jgi:hypothetical protein
MSNKAIKRKAPEVPVEAEEEPTVESQAEAGEGDVETEDGFVNVSESEGAGDPAEATETDAPTQDPSDAEMTDAADAKLEKKSKKKKQIQVDDEEGTEAPRPAPVPKAKTAAHKPKAAAGGAGASAKPKAKKAPAQESEDPETEEEAPAPVKKAVTKKGTTSPVKRQRVGEADSGSVTAAALAKPKSKTVTPGSISALKITPKSKAAAPVKKPKAAVHARAPKPSESMDMDAADPAEPDSESATQLSPVLVPASAAAAAAIPTIKMDAPVTVEVTPTPVSAHAASAVNSEGVGKAAKQENAKMETESSGKEEKKLEPSATPVAPTAAAASAASQAKPAASKWAQFVPKGNAPQPSAMPTQLSQLSAAPAIVMTAPSASSHAALDIGANSAMSGGPAPMQIPGRKVLFSSSYVAPQPGSVAGSGPTAASVPTQVKEEDKVMAAQGSTGSGIGDKAMVAMGGTGSGIGGGSLIKYTQGLGRHFARVPFYIGALDPDRHMSYEAYEMKNGPRKGPEHTTVRISSPLFSFYQIRFRMPFMRVRRAIGWPWGNWKMQKAWDKMQIKDKPYQARVSFQFTSLASHDKEKNQYGLEPDAAGAMQWLIKVDKRQQARLCRDHKIYTATKEQLLKTKPPTEKNEEYLRRMLNTAYNKKLCVPVTEAKDADDEPPLVPEEGKPQEPNAMAVSVHAAQGAPAAPVVQRDDEQRCLTEGYCFWASAPLFIKMHEGSDRNPVPNPKIFQYPELKHAYHVDGFCYNTDIEFTFGPDGTDVMPFDAMNLQEGDDFAPLIELTVSKDDKNVSGMKAGLIGGRLLRRGTPLDAKAMNKVGAVRIEEADMSIEMEEKSHLDIMALEIRDPFRKKAAAGSAGPGPSGAPGLPAPQQYRQIEGPPGSGAMAGGGGSYQGY